MINVLLTNLNILPKRFGWSNIWIGICYLFTNVFVYFTSRKWACIKRDKADLWSSEPSCLSKTHFRISSTCEMTICGIYCPNISFWGLNTHPKWWSWIFLVLMKKKCPFFLKSDKKIEVDVYLMCPHTNEV